VLSVYAGETRAVAFPSDIVYSVPITLTNQQRTATPAPFQQMITVNSAQYSTYEASNLQNVEFLNSDGSVIPSWLESGGNSSSTASVYWLSLATPIPAHSNTTIYIGFASPSTNLLNKVNVGEAPQLSRTYGLYDDGANVFPYYQSWGFSSDLPLGGQRYPTQAWYRRRPTHPSGLRKPTAAAGTGSTRPLRRA